MSTTRRIGGLVGFVLLVALVSLLGQLATSPAIDGWYAGLVKPSWTPPNWVFAPIWTLLYLMIAIGGWRIWLHQGHACRAAALRAFGIQLGLNLAWSLIFFGMRAPWAGMLIMALLIIAIIWQIRTALRLEQLAAWLFVPYLLWVIYAATLNGGIIALN